MNNTAERRSEMEFQYSSPSGTVSLDGFWDWSQKRQSAFRNAELGFIFQSTHLFDSLSIWDNVKLPALDNSMDPAALDNKLSGLFHRILDGVDPKKSGTAVSGGQRQRLAFIRAFCAPHNVLLADEPTGNLDPGNAHALMKEVKANARDGKTAIIVSHDIPLALQFADRIILLKRDPNMPGEPGVHSKALDFSKDKEQANWKDATGGQTSSTALKEMIQGHFEDAAKRNTTA